MGRIVTFLVSGVVWFLIWFPLGIMYTVQANSESKLVKFIANMKGLWDLFN